MVDRTFDVIDVITASLHLMLLRGLMWIVILLHFSSGVATLTLIALIVGTILSEFLFEEVSIPLDIVLSILAFIAVLNVTENWLAAVGGVVGVNLLIRFRFSPF